MPHCLPHLREQLRSSPRHWREIPVLRVVDRRRDLQRCPEKRAEKVLLADEKKVQQDDRIDDVLVVR